MILLIIVMVLELLVLVVSGLRFLIKGFGALKDHNKIKQPKLSTAGEIIGCVGLFLVIGLTRVLGVRGTYSTSTISEYDLIVFVGLLLILTGSQFVLAGYETEENTP